MITLLDYGAGNVRSVRNAIARLGHTVRDVQGPQDILTAEKLIFPGVGSFGSVMERLQRDGLVEPLIERIRLNKPFLGICVALQALFEGSEESPGVAGLAILPGQVKRLGAVIQGGNACHWGSDCVAAPGAGPHGRPVPFGAADPGAGVGGSWPALYRDVVGGQAA